MESSNLLIEVDTDQVIRSSRETKSKMEPDFAIDLLMGTIGKIAKRVMIVRQAPKVLELTGPVDEIIPLGKWLQACNFGKMIDPELLKTNKSDCPPTPGPPSPLPPSETRPS